MPETGNDRLDVIVEWLDPALIQALIADGGADNAGGRARCAISIHAAHGCRGNGKAVIKLSVYQRQYHKCHIVQGI